MLKYRRSEKPFAYAALVTAAVVVVGPFLWILMTSFQRTIDIFVGAWRFSPTLDNYNEVLFSRSSTFVANVQNSAIVAVGSVVIVLTLGSLAAYSLAGFRWSRWVSGPFLAWTLALHMIPGITLVGPLFLLLRSINLFDTVLGLILVHVAFNLPMTIWLMISIFQNLPVELEEAAQVDGATRMKAFTRVTLPLAVPGLVAAGVLAFVFSWNEFGAALNLTATEAATVPIGIARFAQQFEVLHGEMAAASMLSAIPAVLLMFAAQRFIVQGLTFGAVK